MRLLILTATAWGSCFHLTRKQLVRSVLELTTGSTLDPEIDRGDSCIARWHGRGDRMRLNKRPLGEKRLQNVWVSERKFAGCCKIETRKRPPVSPIYLHLAGQNLNASRLNFAEVICRIRFRQKDFLSDLLLEDPTSLGQRQEMQYGEEIQPRSGLRLSKSRLGMGDTISGQARGRIMMLISMVQDAWSEVSGAWDIVDRWQRRGPALHA